MKSINLFIVCSTLVLMTSPALAADDSTRASQKTSSQTTTSGFVAAGVGVAPAFEGTDQYQAIPFFFGQATFDNLKVIMRGTQLKFDFVADRAWDIGPLINYRGKRNSSDGSGPVKRLSDVKGALELGGFINYRFGGDSSGEGEITLGLSGEHDVNDAYDGVVIAGNVSYALVRDQKWSVDINGRTTWGNKDYQRSYFGISRSDAVRSGLDRYHPDAGFRDVTAGVTVGYQLTQRFGLIARGSLTRYIDESADSPIVDEGSKTAGLVGLAGSYRF